MTREELLLRNKISVDAMVTFIKQGEAGLYKGKVVGWDENGKVPRVSLDHGWHKVVRLDDTCSVLEVIKAPERKW